MATRNYGDFNAIKGKVESNTYEIGNHQYPIDLDSPQYGGHRVVFFINVQGNGSLVRADKNNTQTVGVAPSRYSRYSGMGAESADRIRGLLLDSEKSSAGVAAQADSYTDANGNAVSTPDVAYDSKGAFQEAKESVINFIQPKRRLKEAISLYVPESVVKGYSTNWGDEDLIKGETFATAIAGTVEASGLGNKVSAGAAPFLSATARNILSGQKYVQKATGIAPGNTKEELLFRGIDFNTFTFDYKFAPRTPEEAKNVLNIVRTFRHHMLPEYFDSLGYTFVYPSEFEIRYYQNDKENDKLEQHLTAVLTNMSVNYTPNGQFMTFPDGTPTHIAMTLSFKELGMATKETSPANRSGA